MAAGLLLYYHSDHITYVSEVKDGILKMVFRQNFIWNIVVFYLVNLWYPKKKRIYFSNIFKNTVISIIWKLLIFFQIFHSCASLSADEKYGKYLVNLLKLKLYSIRRCSSYLFVIKNCAILFLQKIISKTYQNTSSKFLKEIDSNQKVLLFKNTPGFGNLNMQYT